MSEQVRDLDGRMTARFANRNNFTSLDTRSIFFDSGRSDLKDEGMTMLLEVVKALKEDPNAISSCRPHRRGGHGAANVHSPATAWTPSPATSCSRERRAAADPLVGLGKAVPVADNNTREGRAKNRRVDVTLLSPQS